MPADRLDFATSRTDRPDRAARSLGERSETERPHAPGPFDPGLPTVADVLGVASLRAGIPELLAGSVDAPVRWVHVSDSERVAALLDGGELLLTTGAGWSGAAAPLTRLVDELADAGLAGIVLELGTRFAVAPPALVAACRRRDLALVTLEQEVKFVAVTEEVHRRIIAGQVEALQERQRLHELFTGLSLRGAPVEVVVHETARALRAPAVLEDLAHEVVIADTAELADAEVLAGWTGRSRRLPSEWTRVPVAARGVQWGELVALPGPPHPAGRSTVLEQAATALALSRLADGEGAWARLRADTVLTALVGERHASDADIEARLEASGFPVGGRTMYVAVGASAGSANVPSGSDEVRMLTADIGTERILLLSLPAGSRLPASALAALGAGAVSDPLSSTVELLAALSVVRRLAAQASPGELLRVGAHPLARLAAELSGDHRLQEHSARMLAPLIRHDDATDGDLIRVLRAVVAHPGNRTAAANASHLSRSVFYQRLALIADLLGADLDDGETLSALHLALLAQGR